MAEVFRAVAHGVEGFARVFVIKRILKEKSQSKDFIDMFVAEARVSALLNHPNIVQSYDFGQINGSYFISMEYLRGKDLLSLMRQLRAARKQLDPAVAAYIAQQVASGLHYAHSLTGAGGKPLNIVHRDVSPSNIMLLRAGGVKLLDFGIAKVGESQRGAQVANGEDAFIKGKLTYVSPEQVRGDALDGRSDVFSLGVCLWEMLTGRRLFFDKNEANIVKNVLDRPVIPPSMKRPDLPTALDYVVVRALDRDVSRRYRTAREMADELDAFLASAQFSASALPRVLDDLFGVDTGIFDAETESAALASWGELGSVDVSAVHESAGSGPQALPSAGGARAEPRPAARQPAGRPRRIPLMWGVAGAALTAALTFGLARARGPQERLVPAPTVREAPPVAAPSAHVPESVEPLAPAPPPLPATVELRVESQPRRAHLMGPDGVFLGITPVSITVARSQAPIILTLRRAGFSDLLHEVVPDRDAQLVLSLLRKGPRTAANEAAALGPAPASDATPPQVESAEGAPQPGAGFEGPTPEAEIVPEAPAPPPADPIEPLVPAGALPPRDPS